MPKFFDENEDAYSLFSRPTFVKIHICFDTKDARFLNIGFRRANRTRSLNSFRQYVSGVAGSENVKIWVTRSKSPEERIRTRAIFLTKEFYAGLLDKDPNKPKPFPPCIIDIVRSGKVFIGKHQLVGNIHRKGEPSAYHFF